MGKSLPAKRETWAQSPSQEDALEKELATHSSILSWRVPTLSEPYSLLNLLLKHGEYVEMFNTYL